VWPGIPNASLLPETTEITLDALTVAGQWRIFTAFPNILVSLGDLLRAELLQDSSISAGRSGICNDPPEFIHDTRLCLCH